MSWQISLCITLILIILGLLFKDSKKIWFLQLVWIWILLAGSNGGVDYDVHVHMFETSATNLRPFSSSWLYSIISFPFWKIGFEFYQFNFIISTIILFLVINLIKNNTKNVAFVTSLFIIFPFADSVIQKRNLLADIIFLYGLLTLIKNQNKAELKYIVLTLFAAQIHPAFYIYLILLPFYKMKTKTLNSTLFIFLIIAFMSIPFLPKIANIILGSTAIASKITLYFETLKIPLYQSICWWILQIIFTFLFNFITNNTKDMIEDKISLNNNILKINKILLMLMPLYYYEATFFRLYRNVLLLEYIIVGICYEKEYKLTKNKFYGNVALISFATLVFLSQFVFFGQGFEKLVVPIFEENFIIGG